MIAPAALFSDSTTPLLSPAQPFSGKNRMLPGVLPMVFFVLAAWSAPGFAQQTAKPAVAASGVAGGKTSAAQAKVAPALSKPSWAELTALQQQTLTPLAGSWNSISEAQKRKWLEISKNYHALPPEGQATMHSRMNEWVALSPQQRAEARLNFAKTKELSRQLTPEEKKAKWQTYQALSVEEKQKLAAKATVRPAGAATAARPVAPQKLAAVPPNGTKPGTKILPSQAASTPAAANTAPAPQN